MYENMNKVTIGGHKIPIKCNFNTLQIFQENFGTLKQFEQKLIGMVPVLDSNGDQIYEVDADGGEVMKFKTTEPNLKAVALALTTMINEGKIQAESQGEDPIDFDYKQAIKDADFSIIEVAVELHTEYRRCFDRKKVKASKQTATRTRK